MFWRRTLIFRSRGLSRWQETNTVAVPMCVCLCTIVSRYAPSCHPLPSHPCSHYTDPTHLFSPTLNPRTTVSPTLLQYTSPTLDLHILHILTYTQPSHLTSHPILYPYTSHPILYPYTSHPILYPYTWHCVLTLCLTLCSFGPPSHALVVLTWRGEGCRYMMRLG